MAIANDASTLAYARETTDRQIWLLEPGDASSNEKVRARALTSGSRLHRDPSLSPDGQQVAFIAGAGTKRNVFITDLVGSEPRQVTFRDHCDGDLAWSPDGRTIAFLAEANGRNQVWTVDTVGGAPVPFVESFSAVRDGNIAWAPGSYIVYQRVGQKNFHQLDPRSGEEWPLFEEDLEGWVFDPRVAPDGNRVAFMWNRSPDGVTWHRWVGPTPEMNCSFWTTAARLIGSCVLVSTALLRRYSRYRSRFGLADTHLRTARSSY